jgi:putative hydrolase of the HAD superfamily
VETIPEAFEDDYVRICPTKTNLFPGAHETLSYLRQNYSLHLISNGFKESTELKIAVTGLGQYFENVFISEVIGFNKPDAKIFDFALSTAKASKKESIMIGDSIEADIRGAIDYGMEAIYFNPTQKDKPADVPRQINDLSELINLF